MMSMPSRRSAKRHRRGVEAPPDLIKGTVQFETEGARLIPAQPGAPRVYIPPEELHGVHNGEQVTVRIEVGRKGRPKGRIVSRGNSSAEYVVGIIGVRGKQWVLLPAGDTAPWCLAASDLGEAHEGDAVAARIVDRARRASTGRVVVTEVLGNPDDPRVQVELLLRSLNLPLAFSDQALAEAAAMPEVLAEEVLRVEPRRRDLRGIQHVTIDGEDARDFDDAVAAQEEAEGVRVWVSIADVSRYVIKDSALDVNARERGTSVYFPHRAIPMLPDKLSSNLCSLVPRRPRLTLTCDMLVHANGRCSDVHVYPSLIQSSARLTYNEVQHTIDTSGANLPSPLAGLAKAAKALRTRRQERGAIDLDIAEAEVILRPDGTAADVRARERFEAHRLIEDLMIAANEAVAELLLVKRRHTMFRVHEAPDRERIGMLAAWSHTVGLPLDAKAADKPKTLARFAQALSARPQSQAGMFLLLRSLAQARYDTRNLGHYGLASRAYLHFTSPIRRYPDLCVHRALYALWNAEREEPDLERGAADASMQERRAADAERQVEQLMACHVALRHVGEVFDALVTGVHPAGAFVRVNHPWIEGLLPCASLGSAHRDYYDVVAREQALVGRRSGHRIALGDTVSVRLTSVNTARRHIDFELAPTTTTVAAISRPQPKTGMRRDNKKEVGKKRWQPKSSPRKPRRRQKRSPSR